MSADPSLEPLVNTALEGEAFDVDDPAFSLWKAATLLPRVDGREPQDVEGEINRLAVLVELTKQLDHFLSASNRVIEEAYTKVDRTAGLRMKFLTPQGIVEGVVLRCDPAIGLMVQTAIGVRNLPSTTTRVQP